MVERLVGVLYHVMRDTERVALTRSNIICSEALRLMRSFNPQKKQLVFKAETAEPMNYIRKPMCSRYLINTDVLS